MTFDITSSLPHGGGCFSLPRLIIIYFFSGAGRFVCFGVYLFLIFSFWFIISFLYIYFLYFPDDFCMLLLLSVSTVTARVSLRRFPSNGKLCIHGITFE